MPQKPLTENRINPGHTDVYYVRENITPYLSAQAYWNTFLNKAKLNNCLTLYAKYVYALHLIQRNNSQTVSQQVANLYVTNQD